MALREPRRRIRDPGANRALALGVLSLLVGVLGPFAIVTGLGALDRIAAERGVRSGRGAATVGLLCGVLATFFMLAGVTAFCAAQIPLP